MYSSTIQEQVLMDHPDLYQKHASGFPTLTIQGGELSLGSVVAAPFGCKPLLATEAFADAMS